MRFKRWVMLLAAGMLAIVSMAATPSNSKPTLEQVGEQVYCLCGCVTLLNRCPHLPSECASRAEMQTLILKDIQQGKADPAILQDLVGRYGLHVLAAPPAVGFNLAAWVLPGVALVIGLVIVLAIVRRWRAKVSGAAKEEMSTSIDPKVMAAIEEEMNRIESLKD